MHSPPKMSRRTEWLCSLLDALQRQKTHRSRSPRASTELYNRIEQWRPVYCQKEHAWGSWGLEWETGRPRTQRPWARTYIQWWAEKFMTGQIAESYKPENEWGLDIQLGHRGAPIIWYVSCSSNASCARPPLIGSSTSYEAPCTACWLMDLLRRFYQPAPMR